MKASRIIRRRFFHELWRGLAIIWPVLSGLLVLMALIGLLVAKVEGWPLSDGLYFSFVTGLTVGYGDLVPKAGLSRVLAMSIGLCGIVLTGLVVAIAVEALRAALSSEDRG
ncbi:Ion channel [Variovorax sp. HW608]|uniref:potassium channel family protein n=1 Tax=Variovorax sp. HW608 TaxID=1034889 RepID=UPI00081FE0F1|nr:potassium channel family protein [Variovorax sp. HW608]SCK50382.1 Ion channel [Variovorax sp. HW608]